MYTYTRCTYSNFGREIIIHTVIYGVYIRFWPTLLFNGYRKWYEYGYEEYNMRRKVRKQVTKGIKKILSVPRKCFLSTWSR